MSLPRSGSTLVQRVLGAHPKVSTLSEPWILLPLVYARRWNGIRADYSAQLAADAIDDFANSLDGGAATFEMRMRTFVEQLYRDAADDDATYFLDKTPTYHHIAEDVLRLFPDGKFIFLWRNPLAVLASTLELFRKNRFEPYEFPAELVRGPSALTAAFDANRDRAHAVRFEDLLGENREDHWRAMFDYLELDWNPELLERFSTVRLRNFGDPTGSRMYSRLSTEPLEKWRKSFRGPVRQAWAVHYWLERLGSAPLEIMGYDPESVIRDVRSAGPARVDKVAMDAVLLTGSASRRLFRKQALRIQDIPRMLGPEFDPRPRATVEGIRHVRRFLFG
jgi:hypothetical protein